MPSGTFNIDSQRSGISPNTASHPLEREAWKSTYVLSEHTERDLRSARDYVADRILTIQAAIAKLSAKCDILVARKALLDAAVAPHKKLPVELLSRVFWHCAESPLHLPPPKNASGAIVVEANLSILAVCSLWRQVGLQTRMLWDNIVVSYPPSSHSVNTYYPEMAVNLGLGLQPFIAPVMEQLAPGPLREITITNISQRIITLGTRIIEVRLPKNDRAVPSDAVNRLILPFSSQFKHITLVCSSTSLAPFLTADPPDFGSLESITLQTVENGDRQHNPYAGTTYNNDTVIQVFKYTPALRRLILKSYSLGFLHSSQRPALDIPWEQLTYISLADTPIPIAAAHYILAQSERLLQCDLLIIEPLSGGSASTRTTFIHPHLRSLTLSIPSGLSSFLRPLILPSLETFIVGQSAFYEGSRSLPGTLDTGSVIVAFLLRSRHRIQTFRMSFQLVTESEVEKLLSTLSPTIRDLYIPRVLLSNSALLEIEQGTSIPNLVKIECTIAGQNTSLELFMDMMLHGGKGFENRTGGLRTAIAHQNPGFGILRDPRWTEVSQEFAALSEQLEGQGRIMRSMWII